MLYKCILKSNNLHLFNLGSVEPIMVGDTIFDPGKGKSDVPMRVCERRLVKQMSAIDYVVTQVQLLLERVEP